MPITILSTEASLVSVPPLWLNAPYRIMTDAQSAFVILRKDSSTLEAQAEITTINTLKVSLNNSTSNNCLTKYSSYDCQTYRY